MRDGLDLIQVKCRTPNRHEIEAHRSCDHHDGKSLPSSWISMLDPIGSIEEETTILNLI
jgi:hypothetical protein